MARTRFVTMQDVADEVGLTKASVSLALRNHPSIPPSTQLRITRAARKLGYRPNPLVSALMSQHLRNKPSGSALVLGYVTSHPPEDPWRSYSSYLQMFEGAQQRATELGCRLEEFPLTGVGMTAARLGGILRARGIRGVLAAPLPGNQTAFELDVAQLCVVGVGISVVEPAVMRVAGDLFQIGRLAVRHCAELGYRRIGFAVSVEMSERLEHRLLAGYRQGLFDVSQPETVAPLMPPRTADFASHLPAWYAREQPEVVIFGTFDDKCQRTLPPEIGCVATSVMSSVSPLTGVFQNLRTVGAIAVEQLLGELYHNATGPLDGSRTYYLQGRWNPGITAPGPGARRVAIVVDA